jgi:hypothetical protein
MGGNGQHITKATLHPGKSRGTHRGCSGNFCRREKTVVPADIRTLNRPARSLVAIPTAHEQQINTVTITCYGSRICLQGRSVRRVFIRVEHVLLNSLFVSPSCCTPIIIERLKVFHGIRCHKILRKLLELV